MLSVYQEAERLLPVRGGMEEQDKAAILAQIPLQQLGTPQDIAQALLFLLQSPYINGHILTVDGGRSISGSAKA